MNGIEHWLEKPVLQAIESLRSKSVAADVGANSGTWTRPLSSIFERVVAFEPDRRESQKIPRLQNVAVVEAAVSDMTGTTTLYVRNSSGHNSLLKVHPIGGEGMADAPAVAEVEVECVTLEQFLPSGADFVKMDIEGGELLALAGCRTPAVWSRTVFIVECHDTYDGVAAELARLGKEVTRIPHPLVAHPGHCWALGTPKT
jgi:FkbM family methyltransferase